MEELANIVLASRRQPPTKALVPDPESEGLARSEVTYEDIISIGISSAFSKWTAGWLLEALPIKFGVKVLFEKCTTLEQLGSRFRDARKSGYGDAHGIELLEPVEVNYIFSLNQKRTNTT